LTELVVERALSAVLAQEASLDERSTGGGTGADIGGAGAGVLEKADLAVVTNILVSTHAGVASLPGHTGALVLTRVGVARVHLNIADVMVLLSGETHGALA